MRDGDTPLGCGEGAGQRRSHVSDHNDQIRLVRYQRLFETAHHLSHAVDLTALDGLQKSVGGGQLELVEEDVRHLVVVVLPGVDQDDIELVGETPELRQERRHLHKVRPGPGDYADLHGQPREGEL